MVEHVWRSMCNVLTRGVGARRGFPERGFQQAEPRSRVPSMGWMERTMLHARQSAGRLAAREGHTNQVLTRIKDNPCPIL
eukprot:scaffold649_cov347-Pavlova_lutheri.AAC.97